MPNSGSVTASITHHIPGIVVIESVRPVEWGSPEFPSVSKHVVNIVDESWKTQVPIPAESTLPRMPGDAVQRL
jgi:hypothetical protein